MVGRQQRHLLAAHDGDEGGAQGDLGLAEADVAADQAVHRFAGSHVGDHGIDGGGLVRRFLEAEALGKGFVIVRRILEGVALAQRAARVQVQQFGGGIADLLRGLAARLFPLARAERMQRRIFRRGARIARNDVQLRHRHVQLRILGVFQVQEFGFAIAHVHADQAQIAADAVVDMHHRVADLQLRQVAHHGLDLAGAFLLAAAGAPARAGIQFGLGDEDQVGAVGQQLETRLQRRHAQHQLFRRGGEIGKAVAGRKVQAEFAEVLRQRFTPSARFGAHHDALGVRRSAAGRRAGW